MLNKKVGTKEFKKEKAMSKKIKNNKRTYAIQCSRCKKIIFPQTEAEKREFEELATVEDLIKSWVLGKINIFSEIPNAVRKFIEESISSAIEGRVLEVLLSYPVCNCEYCSYGAIKCRKQRR